MTILQIVVLLFVGFILFIMFFAPILDKIYTKKQNYKFLELYFNGEKYEILEYEVGYRNSVKFTVVNAEGKREVLEKDDTVFDYLEKSVEKQIEEIYQTPYFKILHIKKGFQSSTNSKGRQIFVKVKLRNNQKEEKMLFI